MSDKRKPVRIMLAGIGGYGGVYVGNLLPRVGDGTFEIVGIADPRPENCKELAALRKLGAPEFATIEDFYAQGGKADLAVLSTPIQFHSINTRVALAAGSNVLCEKPLAATLSEAGEMIKARDASGKFVAIGYQWSYTKAIQNLKADIIAGVFGKPKRLKTIILWPRGASYFARPWAGKIRDSEGRPVYDSVANNAAAHYLHNMLYVLGSELSSSAEPEKVIAELYRANAIENFDTAAIKVTVRDGVELLFLATHAVAEILDPLFEYEFENATVTYGKAVNGKKTISAYFRDGTSKEYGDPETEPLYKLWQSIDAVSTGSAPLCGIEAASKHTMCIDAAQKFVPKIIDFPADRIRIRAEGEVKWVGGLAETFIECYETFKMPAETGKL